MRIPEAIDTRGEFWLPNEQENRFPGSLHISKSSEVTLEMKGAFGDPLAALGDILKGDIQLQDWIVGEVEDGGPVTLERCYCINHSQNYSSGQSESLFLAETAFMGVRRDRKKRLTFSTIDFSVDLFDDVVSFNSVTDELASELAREPLDLPGEEFSMSLPHGVGLKLELGTDLRQVATSNTKYTTVATAHLYLTPKEPQTIAYFLALIHKICNFLSLAVDQTVWANSITGYLEVEPETGANGQAPIKIFHQTAPHREEKPRKKRADVLFTLEGIADRLPVYMTAWLENYEKCEAAFNLYFSPVPRSSLFLDVRLLQLAQGLETVNRRTYPESKVMEDDEFQDILDSMLQACPPDKRDRLEVNLAHANDPNLGSRIKETVTPFQRLFGSRKDRKRFIYKVVKTRNYLTHYDESGKEAAATGESLIRLTQKLEALFQLELLRIIGFDIERIVALTQSNLNLKIKLSR